MSTEDWITEAKLHFREPLQPLQDVDSIIVHHTEEEGWDIHRTHAYHQDTMNWSGIGYNFFIEAPGVADGQIRSGRGYHVGAHTLGRNETSIGVCMSGNMDLHHPSKRQMDSLLRLCRYLMDRYKLSPEDVVGHREVAGVTKSCPGSHVDMNWIRMKLSSRI
ncbi:peptidoglycan recognition protein family protein [Paenibacillus tianjinensis]|uniref:N-acetylmuramoyl-L-alanine amidase n=1 Tax=Paenibacillus tianjinensis TaxID=2810347 RepID=A0ABX7LA44_9BACL|nr:peptidoglycan recognition family protein [Paenibacillus tianjinensis]QSF45050.1 N-acetylmuramoyl-L-alanine amidase [Paenibacillus tianjinensis]